MTNAESILGKIMSGKKPSVENILGKSYNKKHYEHESKETLLHEERETPEFEAKEEKDKHHRG
jgi:hypothetical protein